MNCFKVVVLVVCTASFATSSIWPETFEGKDTCYWEPMEKVVNYNPLRFITLLSILGYSYIRLCSDIDQQLPVHTRFLDFLIINYLVELVFGRL